MGGWKASQRHRQSDETHRTLKTVTAFMKIPNLKSNALLLLQASAARLATAAPAAGGTAVAQQQPLGVPAPAWTGDTALTDAVATISFGRQRQMATTNAAGALDPVFEANGARGPWWNKVIDKLVDSGHEVRLVDTSGRETRLATRAAWASFLDKHVSSKKQADALPQAFGISFKNLASTLDNVAGGNATNVLVDLDPRGALAAALSFDTKQDLFATKLKTNATFELPGTHGAGSAIAVSLGVPGLGPDLLDSKGPSWERDRIEGESWRDYKFSPASDRLFRANTGPMPFLGLTEPKWNDTAAMGTAALFASPLHLELRSDNPPVPQDNTEKFRENYYGFLQNGPQKAGISLRVRLRFDEDNGVETERRLLAQGKSDREIGNGTDRSAVHKWESRWSPGEMTEAQGNLALMSGKEPSGRTTVAAQKTYELLTSRGFIQPTETVHIEPQHILLQHRRRTHLQLDNVRAVVARRAAVLAERKALTDAGQPVDPRLDGWVKKLDAQIKYLQDTAAVLAKHGEWMPSGECMIVSADRWAAYDFFARTTRPNQVGDEQGRVGRGLHIEAEVDTNCSESYEKAGVKIDEAIAAIDQQLAIKPPPANAPELEAQRRALVADRAVLDAAWEVMLTDLDQVVTLLDQRLVGAGLESDPTRESKDDRAKKMMRESSDARPYFWS
jgi:hypothetical protein